MPMIVALSSCGITAILGNFAWYEMWRIARDRGFRVAPAGEHLIRNFRKIAADELDPARRRLYRALIRVFHISVALFVGSALVVLALTARH